MAYTIKFNEEKNQLLKATRGISFEDVLRALKEKNLLVDISHPSNKHSNQRVYIIKIKEYAYAVPYVINSEKHEIFLKTIYPSRVFIGKYMKGAKMKSRNDSNPFTNLVLDGEEKTLKKYFREVNLKKAPILKKQNVCYKKQLLDIWSFIILNLSRSGSIKLI